MSLRIPNIHYKIRVSTITMNESRKEDIYVQTIRIDPHRACISRMSDDRSGTAGRKK